ncbi:MAG: hypothetical protein ACREYA_22950 [Cupriavidus necator]
MAPARRQGAAPGKPTAFAGPFTPYAVPLPPERVAAMLAELRELIGALADAEGWPDTHRANLVALVGRQPAFTLADDLAHFRARLVALQAASVAAGAIENRIRTCGTCAHRQLRTYGVPVGCAMSRAQIWRHHAWLDSPDTPNPCDYFERKAR